MFHFNNGWHSFKKEMLVKYASQINKVRYRKTNRSLLIVAVHLRDGSLFNEILNSPYLNDALKEEDFEGHNALSHTFFDGRKNYDRLIEYGATLSSSKIMADKLIVDKYRELMAHRNRCSSDYYDMYMNRVIHHINHMKDINYETDGNHTLLTMAVEGADMQMIDYLLNRKANPTAGYVDVNTVDMNAFELAVYLGNQAVIKRIKAAMDNKNDMHQMSMDEVHKKVIRAHQLGEKPKMNHLCFSVYMTLLLAALIVCGVKDCSNAKEYHSPKSVPTSQKQGVSMRSDYQRED